MPQQLHLDSRVDDLDRAASRLQTLGATVREHQPAGARVRVAIDPAGHPFCLAPKSRERPWCQGRRNLGLWTEAIRA
ncbi:VOC family protein [Nocardia sp. A7]|uniref:VOC family protein n=1 Tax=Nocardia sp. A7 TaxID=2789274 RepID=UPI00397868E7